MFYIKQKRNRHFKCHLIKSDICDKCDDCAKFLLLWDNQDTHADNSLGQVEMN